MAAHAATLEHEAPAGGGGLMSIQVNLMFWTLLIFVILFFILTKFAFGPLTAAVAAREKALEDAISAANRDREEAARLLEEQRRQIEAARNDAQRIIAEGRSTGEKMRADMLEQTRAQQNELLDRARREIEGEKVRAIAELRREAVDLAIAGAGKVIERNLDDDANRRLVELGKAARLLDAHFISAAIFIHVNLENNGASLTRTTR
jgi:F-type H+-transporting ATPase subunit b